MKIAKINRAAARIHTYTRNRSCVHCAKVEMHIGLPAQLAETEFWTACFYWKLRLVSPFQIHVNWLTLGQGSGCPWTIAGQRSFCPKSFLSGCFSFKTFENLIRSQLQVNVLLPCFRTAVACSSTQLGWLQEPGGCVVDFHSSSFLDEFSSVYAPVSPWLAKAHKGSQNCALDIFWFHVQIGLLRLSLQLCWRFV